MQFMIQRTQVLDFPNVVSLVFYGTKSRFPGRIFNIEYKYSHEKRITTKLREDATYRKWDTMQVEGR